MTYNVFGGTLNLAQFKFRLCLVRVVQTLYKATNPDVCLSVFSFFSS